METRTTLTSDRHLTDDQHLLAELSVIAYILCAPEPVARIPRLRIDCFSDPRCAMVWDIVLRLQADGSPVCWPTIAPVLQREAIDLSAEFLHEMQLTRKRMDEPEYIHCAQQLFVSVTDRTVGDRGVAPSMNTDIIPVHSLREDIFTELEGRGDHGYDIGYGALTNRYFRLDSGGGIVVLTGYPNQGKTDWLRCTLAQLMYRQQRHVVMLSFEEPNKAKLAARMVQIGLDSKRLEDSADADRCIDYLDRHITFLSTDHRRPTITNIIALIEEVMVFQPVDYVVIDPYLYIQDEGGGDDGRETERIKRMLTRLHSWSQSRHLWTFIVAHPRKKTAEEEGETYERLTGHLIAGSAHWLNIAEFVLAVSRVFQNRDGGTDQPSYTLVESLKVRDQDICQRGKMYFFRRPSGQYREVDMEDAKLFNTRHYLSESQPWI